MIVGVWEMSVVCGGHSCMIREWVWTEIGPVCSSVHACGFTYVVVGA